MLGEEILFWNWPRLYLGRCDWVITLNEVTSTDRDWVSNNFLLLAQSYKNCCNVEDLEYFIEYFTRDSLKNERLRKIFASYKIISRYTVRITFSFPVTPALWPNSKSICLRIHEYGLRFTDEMVLIPDHGWVFRSGSGSALSCKSWSN